MNAMIGRMIALVLLAVAIVMPADAVSAQVQNKGLLIAPLRQEIILKKGAINNGKFTIGNYSEEKMAIELSVKQFSVRDLSYEYEFKDPTDKWVQLRDTKVELQPNQTKEIAYTVTVPADAAPGGHYFTMIASTKALEKGLPITLQAATQLYLTTDGTLRNNNSLGGVRVPGIMVSRQVPYEFDVKNTGNVHFKADFYAQVDAAKTSAKHYVMPDTTRTIKGQVTVPAMPGVYDMTYGYTIEGTADPVTGTTRVLYLPPWSIIAFIVGIISVAWITAWYRRKRSKRSQQEKSD